MAAKKSTTTADQPVAAKATTKRTAEESKAATAKPTAAAPKNVGGSKQAAAEPKTTTTAKPAAAAPKAASVAKPAAAEPAAPKVTELHHPSVEPATPAHLFDDATLDVSAEGALAAVARTPAGKHEALVQAWVARRNAAAIGEVARHDDAPGAARKAARRAVGMLKSRGIAIPERTSVVNLVNKPSFAFEARALFPDGRGAMMWWIAKIGSTGATEVIEVTTHDRSGIAQVNRGNPTAGNLRQVWNSWSSRVGRAPSEVPLEWARYRIAQARRITLVRKGVLPMGLDAARELLGEFGAPPATPPQHPIELEELALPSEPAAVRARLEKSMHLHEEPEFGTWLPEDSVAVELLQSISTRVQELGEKPEQPKVDAIVNSAIEEAADAYFSQDRKALYITRLLDAAWSMYCAGLVDRAIDALMVAQAIDKAGIVSDRPSEIGFVRGLFVKLLAVAQQRAAAMSPRPNEEGARLEGGR